MIDNVNTFMLPNLNFRQWLEDSRSDAEAYFGIGHGDYSDEHGYEPNYVVWAYLDSGVEVGPEVKVDPETGEGETSSTHGTQWGHHLTDKTYKGRYEPQTGRLSIVKPHRYRNQNIPSTVMRDLYKKFGPKLKVSVF